MKTYCKYFLPIYRYSYIMGILQKCSSQSPVFQALTLENAVYNAANFNYGIENALKHTDLQKYDYVARWKYNDFYKCKILDIVCVHHISNNCIIGFHGERIAKNQIICAFRR